ncbi:MAG: NUDIX domain-containing protein [Candidatus Peribacteria bacterium]|jgi:8-oxo-dGTP pyrophosphatase MutT (NUDIX family)|nr:NUDIX domain-containing protein [Candidatus Peribacteria bacterium]
MSDIVQSAGGIIYYLAPDGEPRYLLIKRHALSGKIERVAPKGKIQIGETEKDAAIREMREETGIPKQDLVVKQLLGTTSLRSTETKKGHLDKDVTYFLMKYTGNPTTIQLTEGEGYIGVYKRATIQEVINLIYYEDIRELVRKSYFFIKEEQKNWSVKKDFLNKLT